MQPNVVERVLVAEEESWLARIQIFGNTTSRFAAGAARDAELAANPLEIARALSAGAERFGWRLVHYSIQATHLHLIGEVRDRRALSRGVQGLAVRLARALNKSWRRSGAVFADRYHARALRTPREVRNALLYVLQNARHHGYRLRGIDLCSSGGCFDGWARPESPKRASNIVVAARTWLIRVGWRRHGLIALEERPRSTSARARSHFAMSTSDEERETAVPP